MFLGLDYICTHCKNDWKTNIVFTQCCIKLLSYSVKISYFASNWVAPHALHMLFLFSSSDLRFHKLVWKSRSLCVCVCVILLRNICWWHWWSSAFLENTDSRLLYDRLHHSLVSCRLFLNFVWVWVRFRRLSLYLPWILNNHI